MIHDTDTWYMFSLVRNLNPISTDVTDNQKSVQSHISHCQSLLHFEEEAEWIKCKI